MKSMRWYDHLSVNLFWLGLNIRNTAVGSVFMPFLVGLFVPSGVINTALGELRTAGLIIAMLVQPAVGLLSDRSTSRFGRRRPFIVLGVLLDLVFLAGIGLSRSYWGLFAVLLFQQVSANISHGPLQGLIPDLVPEDQRGRSSGIKAMFELLPLVLVALTIAKLVAGGFFWWAIAVTGGALLVTMILTVLLVKEQPLQSKPDIPLKEPMLRVLGMLAGILTGGIAGLIAGAILGGLAGLIALPIAGSDVAWMVGISLGGIVAMVVAVLVGVWGGTLATLGPTARQHDSFIWWVANRLMFLAAVTSIQGFATYFLMSAFRITLQEGINMTATLMMVVGIFTMLSALPSGWLSDKIGHRSLVGVGGLIATLGTVVLLVTTFFPSIPLIYISGIIIGLAAGLFLTSNWALGTELAPEGEAGRYLGISNLAGAGAGMIGAGIGGPVADLINRYQPGLGYFVIFTGYAILFFLSVVSLRGIRARKAPLPASVPTSPV